MDTPPTYNFDCFPNDDGTWTARLYQSTATFPTAREAAAWLERELARPPRSEPATTADR